MLMQTKNAVGSNTPGAASSAADLEAQEAPKAGPELNSRGFRSVFARFLGFFPRSKAKSEN